MQIYCFDDIVKEPMVIALGFFDCVHIAHRKLIAKALSIAKSKGVKCAVFTFDNDPKEILKNEYTHKLVYDFSTRCDLLEGLGVDIVLKATLDEQFATLSSQLFLIRLFRHNIVGVVCGFDYTFGKAGEGLSNDIVDFCISRKTDVFVLPLQSSADEKISTSRVSSFLLNGQIKEANALLGDSYHYSGFVKHGHEIGRTLGFRTANLATDERLVLIRPGVYFGYALVDGKKYKAIVNVGRRPTFSDDSINIEAHLLDFCDDIYGKKITVFFERFLREQRQFESIEGLKKQLNTDKETAKKL